MKNILLTIFFISSIHISAVNDFSSENNSFQRNNRNGVTFVEGGIQFRVFLNGDFIFDRNIRRTRNNRRSRRIRVERDYLRRVRRVGNVMINYNLRGDVRRIGNIRMQYRRGRLVRVGNLKIVYNRRGHVTFYGRVRYNDFYANNYNNDFIYEFDHPIFYSRNFINTYSNLREDSNYVYYRANRNDGDIKKGTIVKRRKVKEANTTRKRRSKSVNTRSRN